MFAMLACASAIAAACGKTPAIDAGRVSRELKDNLLAAANAFDSQANHKDTTFAAKDEHDTTQHKSDTGVVNIAASMLAEFSPELASMLHFLSTPDAVKTLVKSPLLSELLNPNNVESENAHFAVYNVQRTACDKLRSLTENRDEQKALSGAIGSCKDFLDRFLVQLRVTQIDKEQFAVGVIVGDRTLGAGVDIISFTSSKTSFGARIVLDALSPILQKHNTSPANFPHLPNKELTSTSMEIESMSGTIAIETQYTNGELVPQCPDHMGACTTVEMERPVKIQCKDGSRFNWSKGEGKNPAAVVSGTPRNFSLKLNLGPLDVAYEPMHILAHGTSLEGLLKFNLEDPNRPVLSIKDVKMGTEGALVEHQEMRMQLHLNEGRGGKLDSVEGYMTSKGVDVHLAPLNMTLTLTSKIRPDAKDEPKCLPQETAVISTHDSSAMLHLDLSQLGGGATPAEPMSSASDAAAPGTEAAEQCMQKRLMVLPLMNLVRVKESCENNPGITLTKGAFSINYHADNRGKNAIDVAHKVTQGQCLAAVN
jgi:hypothetical protein